MELQSSLNRAIHSAFLSLDPSVSVKDAIEQMSAASTSCILVIADQRLLGIFTERDVVRITTNTAIIETLTLGSLMTKDITTVTIAETEDIFALSRLFSKGHIRHLPVLDDHNHVIGIVTPHSIRSLLKPEYLLRYVRVAEVMNLQIVQASPTDSILMIAQQMVIHRVSCVVIVDRATTVPIGILTERDIVRFHQLRLDFANTQAQSVMSAPLSTMFPQDSLWVVHQRMKELNVRRLVITEASGKLAGIITQTQMLKILDPTEMYHVMAYMQEIIDRQTHELQQVNQQLRIANRELEQLSKIDELTQVLNRRSFNDVLEQEWERLADLEQPLSLVMCDVDQFKLYNDTYGHLAGDDCLIKIAQTLSGATRRHSDVVARFGGEEFAIVLPNTSQEDAERVAQTIIAQIKAIQIPHIASELSDYITISLGVATTIPDRHSSPAMLLQLADQLLYQAKQNGRDTYRINSLGAIPR
jgi:diguanylate cyclase (GGDEF)-like protein